VYESSSRSGISALGYSLANELGITLIGRATGQHYLVYTHPQRLLRGDSSASF